VPDLSRRFAFIAAGLTPDRAADRTRTGFGAELALPDNPRRPALPSSRALIGAVLTPLALAKAV
jgi:hypothetical protein